VNRIPAGDKPPPYFPEPVNGWSTWSDRRSTFGAASGGIGSSWRWAPGLQSVRGVRLPYLLSIGVLLAFGACSGSSSDDDDDDDDDSAIDGGGVDGAVVPGPALRQLAAGASGTCAVLDDGTVRCWGDNREGQLGDGTTTSSARPVVVAGLDHVVSVSVGYEHACALIDDGTARCWGRNGNGQLGDGTTDDSAAPVTVSNLDEIAQVFAGVYTSCALQTSGSVYCWGRGGDLGDGGVAQSELPQLVPGLSDVVQLSVAANGGVITPIHVCGVRGDGTAFCWGGNADGQLGDGTQDGARAPVEVLGVTDAIEIAAGGDHACARRASGLFCWGRGEVVGDGTGERSFTPTEVSTDATVDALSAGDNHMLARTPEGGLICWGRSSSGQCGDGAAFPPSGPVYLTPVASLAEEVDLFASGGVHACAYTTDQVTYCWGANHFGETGSGTPGSFERSATPAPVAW
jgi:alpha-tubulin suppressor-like RCC1 family protein